MHLNKTTTSWTASIVTEANLEPELPIVLDPFGWNGRFKLDGYIPSTTHMYTSSLTQPSKRFQVPPHPSSS